MDDALLAEGRRTAAERAVGLWFNRTQDCHSSQYLTGIFRRRETGDIYDF
jgi:hypothetical protein